MTSSTEQSQPTGDPMEMLNRHGDKLYCYALSRLRDSDAAEVTVQETLVAALQAHEQHLGTDSQEEWLLGICRRKVIDRICRRSRANAAIDGDLAPNPSEALFDAKGRWKMDPRIIRGCVVCAMSRDEFWQAFRKCLQQLPQRQADVFTLRELEDLASGEICKELEITEPDLRLLLHRARLALTRCLKPYLEN